MANIENIDYIFITIFLNFNGGEVDSYGR